MRAHHMALVAAALAAVSASALFAVDEVSHAMKQLLDSRKDDFASIRKDPHGYAGETTYMSSVLIPGAKQCYIQPESKPHYSDSCDVAESHNRAAVMAKYAEYLKDLKSVSSADWSTWTEKRSKPGGEETFIGPDHEHPAASVRWMVEGMDANYYLLTVTVYADGYVHAESAANR
jgi:hypothetical protein